MPVLTRKNFKMNFSFFIEYINKNAYFFIFNSQIDFISALGFLFNLVYFTLIGSVLGFCLHIVYPKGNNFKN